MKNKLYRIILVSLLSGAGATAAAQNVNTQYEVDKIEISGVPESRVSKTLLADMQKLVGEKYDEEAAHKLANRLRRELGEYSVSVKLRRGDQEKHVRVVFAAERTRGKRFEFEVPPVIYHSKEGLSGAFEIPIRFYRQNFFTFGIVNSADELLERNAGLRLRLENRRVGTDIVQVRIDFDSYHQSFNAATQAALLSNPEVPGIYRTRQNFAPSLSVIPVPDLKLSIGTSFQRFQAQYPVTHVQTAYAGTADLQFRHIVRGANRYRQDVRAAYSLRSSTSRMDSDFVYTRHYLTADYTAWKGRNFFGAHVQAGLITGTAPLFERFSLGNSATLRGWNKFDVAPLGGSRMLHGSLEYRYRPFQIFYDVGVVHDPEEPGKVRHGLGFGWADRDGFFASLAFPVRLHNVVPMFMVGFRR